MDERAHIERRALLLSLAGATGMAALASGFFLWTRSEAVLLDAIFNIITCVMAVLTLRVSRLIQGVESPRFPFGHYGFEAMLNTIKGVVILIVCVLSVVSSLEAIAAGGRVMQVGPAAAYAVIATALCTGLAVVLHHLARDAASPLADLDALNWKMNALISGLVAVAFGVALLFNETSLRGLVPYVDPVLVLALVVAIMKMPIDIVRQGLGGLLLGAPEPELGRDCLARLHGELSRVEHEDVRIRMSKTGRLLYVLIHILERSKAPPLPICKRDEVRARIDHALRGLHPDVVVDVLFTREPRWLGHQVHPFVLTAAYNRSFGASWCPAPPSDPVRQVCQSARSGR